MALGATTALAISTRGPQMRLLRAAILLALTLGATAQASGHRTGVAAPDVDQARVRQMIDDSILRFEIAEDVSVEDAVASMELRANLLNFKLVADLPLSEQVKAMGEQANYMRILAFCDALIAKRMVDYDMIFAGFLPCRMAVLEDADGKGWIVTTNMDMLLQAVDLPPALQVLVEGVRDTFYSIVDAGVNGDL